MIKTRKQFFHADRLPIVMDYLTDPPTTQGEIKKPTHLFEGCQIPGLDLILSEIHKHPDERSITVLHEISIN